MLLLCFSLLVGTTLGCMRTTENPGTTLPPITTTIPTTTSTTTSTTTTTTTTTTAAPGGAASCAEPDMTLTPGGVAPNPDTNDPGTITPTMGAVSVVNGVAMATVTCTAPAGSIAFMEFNQGQFPGPPQNNPINANLVCAADGKWSFSFIDENPTSPTSGQTVTKPVTEVSCFYG